MGLILLSSESHALFCMAFLFMKGFTMDTLFNCDEYSVANYLSQLRPTKVGCL